MATISKKQRQKQWLKLYQTYITPPTITAVCQDIGIQRITFYDWYNNDEKFKAEFDKILNRRNITAKAAFDRILQDNKDFHHWDAVKMQLSREKDWAEKNEVDNNVNINIRFVKGK